MKSRLQVRRGNASGWVILLVLLALLAGIIGYRIWQAQQSGGGYTGAATQPD